MGVAPAAPDPLPCPLMRRIATVLAAALALLGATQLELSTAEAASCGRVRDIGPTGANPADAVGLSTRRVGCRTARRVARQWGRQPVGTRVLGYRCSFSGGVRVRCVRGGRVVRFRLG